MNLTNEQYQNLESEWTNLLEMAPDEFPYRSFDNYYNVKKYLLVELIDVEFKRNLAINFCYMPETSNESEVYILSRLQSWCHQKLLAQLGGIKHFNNFILLYQEEYGHAEAFSYYHEIRNQMMTVYRNRNNDEYSRTFYYIPQKFPTREKWTINISILNMDSSKKLKQKFTCPICLDDHPLIKTIITNCNHNFCKNCICEHIDTFSNKNIPNCPMCRSDVHQFEIKDSEYYQELQEKYN
mgnify:CR=1 FL=1|tara:strand:+ start:2175 stop:2891 length:717 start_codon:yes stop_codon:yes gene_type:complete